MNGPDYDPSLDRLESELRRLKPAVPEDFLTRLSEARPLAAPRPWPASQRESEAWWKPLFGLLVPATALLMVITAFWRPKQAEPGVPTERASAAGLATTEVNADDVNINRELVSAFDAVTSLPTGEAVRFRCRQWMDQVVLRDRESGVLIQQRVPRVEVVPVRFETY